MADDPKAPEETPHFEDTVQADLAIEQGLGVGERELKAQRDPGGVRTANEDSDVEGGPALNADEDEALDGDVSVLGSDRDETAPDAP